MPIAIELSSTLPEPGAEPDGAPAAGAVGVGLYAERLRSGDLPDGLDRGFLEAQGFTAEPGQSCVAPGAGGRLVVALGLGAEAAATPATFRRAGAALARAAGRRPRIAADLVDVAPDRLDREAVGQAVVEGVLLGAYRYTALKSDPAPDHLESLTVLTQRADGLEPSLARGRAVGEAVRLARDLVNQPGGSLTPAAFAERALELGEHAGFEVEVLDRAAIQEQRLGGLLGVNRGSTEEPRFVRLAWQPPGEAAATVALVGKGITFDSGGLSLKTSDGMVGMKGDMAGAAAVLAAFSALGAVQPPVRVLGFLPLTDNMPGGDATRVGDVLRIRNGTTVEVLNTDAEGRLVLADALSLASEAHPDAVVDLATLTGACMVALGRKVAGLMGNDDDLVGRVRRAAGAAGEQVWPLPLPEDMRSSLDSEVADLKNVAGDRWGGALVAGVFLQQFVADGIPWAHLDIAGPADAADEDVETRKGGTGFGVRTLLHLLESYGTDG
ncbi:MAG TPA: leucyl aminopeptidase [Acidimicrobiales bacterium]